MKVRIGVSAALVAFSMATLLPCTLVAQEVLPPRCCDSPVAGLPGIESRVIVTDAALAAIGIDRMQFVDRLIAVMMPDRDTSIVYSTVTSLSPSAVAELGAAGEVPEAVTMSQKYRVPRERMRSEDMLGLDQLSITDGVVSITITFKRAESSPLLP